MRKKSWMKQAALILTMIAAATAAGLIPSIADLQTKTQADRDHAHMEHEAELEHNRLHQDISTMQQRLYTLQVEILKVLRP